MLYWHSFKYDKKMLSLQFMFASHISLAIEIIRFCMYIFLQNNLLCSDSHIKLRLHAWVCYDQFPCQYCTAHRYHMTHTFNKMTVVVLYTLVYLKTQTFGGRLQWEGGMGAVSWNKLHTLWYTYASAWGTDFFKWGWQNYRQNWYFGL